MSSRDAYDLAHALPAGTLLVGPPAWLVRPPASGSAASLAEIAGREGGPLLLLHAGHLRADARPHELAAGLERLLAARPELLPVLIHRRLRAASCATLFRAGLFDALPAPVNGAEWARMLGRLERRRTAGAQLRLVSEEARTTRQLLHAHGRDVRDRAAQLGEELIAVQSRLEEANRRLTDHMEQLALLYRFGRDLGAARNWDATLGRILEALAGHLGAAGASLVLRAGPEGPYAPRRSFGWRDGDWPRVLARLQGLGSEVADRLLWAGEADGPGEGLGRPIVALSLEHQDVRLGFLLLLAGSREVAEDIRRQLPFLRAVQVILGEEVARAQVMDRLREIGIFNTRVLETVQSWIWVVDESGRALYYNRAARASLGGRADEPALDPTDLPFAVGRGRGEAAAGPLGAAAPGGRGWPEPFLDGLLSLPERAGPPLAALLGGEPADFRGEARFVRPDGEVVPVHLQAARMAGRGPDERWLVLVAEDLREARELASQRVRADRLESLVEMSAALAHEIRNPLMGLSAQAELLAEQLPPEDRRRRYLDVITGEVERINGTITRLLSFIRPYEPELGRADLREIARDCLDLVAAGAAKRGVECRLGGEAVGAAEARGAAADRWALTADGDQLKQVILNLLLNAVDASPPGGTVELRLRRPERVELAGDGDGARRLVPGFAVEVADRGPGFAPQDAERIFRPFFTTKSAGTGLGLAICRKIVAAHRGEIRAAREADETVFRMLLPAGAELGTEAAVREARG